MCSDSKNSAMIGFGLGTLLGAGAGVFLSTKKGRKTVKQVWKQIEPYLEDALDTARDEFEGIKGKAKKTAEGIKVEAEDFKGLAEGKARDFKLKTGELSEDLEVNSQGLKEKAPDFRINKEGEVNKKVTQIRDSTDEKISPSLKKPIKRTFFKGV